MARRLLVVVLGSVLLVGALWRSAPSVREGRVLVLADRAAAGPARSWTAPWARRADLPERLTVETNERWDLGDGSVWPARVRAVLELHPARMDDDSRKALLGGVRSLEAAFSAWARRGLERIAAAPGFDPRAILFRKGQAAAALAEPLAALIPPGIDLARLDVEIEVADAASRANALREARTRGTDPLGRVLYVGLDGADWTIADELIRRGELPVIARLLRSGVRADLVSYEPIMSPLLWTTAITGRGPDAHGIFDFTLADEQGQQVPISSRFRKVPAVWEILGAWGDASAFVNFWATHPTEEMNGVLVSDIADALIRDAPGAGPLPAGTVWPTGFLQGVTGLWGYGDVPLAELQRYVPTATAEELRGAAVYWSDERERAAFAEGKTADERKVPPLAFLVQVIANSHNLERIVESLLQRDDLGVVGAYFGEIDQIGHNFQHLAPPPHPLADPGERRFAAVVENAYRAQDAMLGRLIEAAGPETIVLVHSDHGFRWGADRPRDVLPFTRGQPVEWHRLQGMFLAAGGPVRRGETIPDVTLYDVCPTLLALRGIPAADTMPGRVLAELLEPDAPRPPDARIADWDPLLPPRRYAEPGGAGSLDDLRHELVEQLRALGYVGGAGADEPEAGGAAPGVGGGDERPQVTYYRNKATWLMNEKRFAEAEQALLEANELKPLPKTYSLLSEAAAAQGDLERASRALDEGLAAFPEEMPVSAILWQVELQLERGDLQAAQDAYDRGRDARDAAGQAPLIVAEGRLAEARGDLEGARSAYLRALDADPREVRAAQRYAGLAASAEERGMLEPYLRRALELDPRIEIYWQMLGLVRIDRGDPAGAADAFGRAADLEPGNEDHRLNEALAALRAGQSGRARRLLEDLGARDSRLPAVWVHLGRFRATAGDWSGARSAWERAVELGADAPGLAEALEEARRKAGAR